MLIEEETDAGGDAEDNPRYWKRSREKNERVEGGWW